MKIGELFIALGFKVEGQAQFDDAQRGLKDAAASAAKLTLVVNAANLALLAMVDSAVKFGQSLRIFEQTTGGSADELQRWSQAAQIAGVDAASLKGGVMALLDARNAFALGEPQNVGAWQLLGVDPRQDPFAVLDALRSRLAQSRDPNLMRALLGRVGLEGVMPVLQLNPAEFSRFRKELTVTPEQVDRLVALNREWQRLRIGVAAFKNELAAALAPALAVAARGLEVLANMLARFTTWLNSGTTGARTMRVVLGTAAVVLLALGAAIAIVTTRLGALLALSSVLSPALLALAGPLAGILFYATAIVAVIGGLALVIDDIITSLTGGKAVTRTIGEWLAGFKAVQLVIGEIWREWDQFVRGLKTAEAAGGFIGRVLVGQYAALIPSNQGAGQAQVTQHNEVKIQVDGARSPEATGAQVGRSVRDEIAAASRQAPVPGY